MRRNVLYKYFTFGAALILISFIILGIGMSAQVYNYSVSEKEKSLEFSALRISAMTTEINSQFSSIRPQTFRVLISSTLANSEMSAVLCDSSGRIVVTSENVPPPITMNVPPELVGKVIADKYFSGRNSLGSLYKNGHFTVGVPYYDYLGKPAGCVLVTSTISHMRGLLFAIVKIFLVCALVVFLIMLVAAFFGTHRIIRPIKNITTAAREFAHGDFSVRVPVSGNDELGELSRSFNTMADSIEKTEDLRRTFVANVSHELRSPMTSIGGFVDGILDGTIPQESEKKYLEIVSSEVKRLSRLVSNMLEITRLQSEDLSQNATNYDFCNQVRRVIMGFESKINEKNIKINLTLPSDELELCANEDAIFQVIYNLLENALKFSNPDTEMAIDISVKSGKLWFSIKNSGNDIPSDELPYIFDRFHKGDKSRGKDKTSLGLGLYIVKTIVNQHGGDCGAESKNGITEFHFTLPI